jgi:hypothetical protein
MKKMIMCAGVLLVISFTSNAQSGKNASGKKTVAKSSTTKKSAQKNNSGYTKNNSADTLITTASYNALNAPAKTQFYIADPTIKALAARAAGSSVRISGSGVAGMPRGSYGFRNGQFRLYPSGATTSGGNTGNGSVGTGSFTGSIGTHSAAAGVNGKSPYGYKYVGLEWCHTSGL